MMESERYREVLQQLRDGASLITIKNKKDEATIARAMAAYRAELTEMDNVNHPPHYTSHPSGVECITITEHMGFNLGNALKYIWRADLKNDTPLEDLKKAQFYINREIKKHENS